MSELNKINNADDKLDPSASIGIEAAEFRDFAKTMVDFIAEYMENIRERFIMPGMTHWGSPKFHAYFPAGKSYPSIVADMLSGAIACIVFTWIASPACTELEVVMMDWLGKMLDLPAAFLASQIKP